MKLQQNDPRVLFLSFCFASLALFTSNKSSINAQEYALTPPLKIVEKLTKGADGTFRLANVRELNFVLVCNGDTLRKDVDFTETDSTISLITANSCDTILQIATKPYSQIGLQYSLHEFRTTSEGPDLTPQIANESNVNPILPTSSKLAVSGTKTFSADVSDRGSTNLSQGLAMTIAGELGHGINIKGSFSDRGLRNSQLVTKKFSELDNIYVEVESKNMNGVFGNYYYQENRFRYISLSRNVQGLGIKFHNDRHTIEMSLSVPPGNFAEYSFVTTDGNFGPYRLIGPNGESGVAVIENTESVWLNGEKLARGRDQDYYLDYLRGELFFTGKRLIDNQGRVRVDFEFQKSEYRKTLVTATTTNQLADKKLSLDFGYAGVIASRNDPIDFGLSDSDITKLSDAGDDASKAVVSGVNSVGAGQGDYRADTTSTGEPIYTYVGDNNGDLRVSFGDFIVGDYIYLGAGRYQYVGKGLGRYLPTRRLPLPELIQIGSLKSEYNISEQLQLLGETALSFYDKNRFSKLGDGDNASLAANSQLIYRGGGVVKSGTLSGEYLPARFGRLGRLDDVQENYLWQKNSDSLSNRQRYLSEMTLQFSPYDNSRISGGYTKEANGFHSTKIALLSDVKQIANSNFTVDGNYTSSRDLISQNKLVVINPSLKTAVLPVNLKVLGEYDNRKSDFVGLPHTHTSKHALETGAEFRGFSISLRQLENWTKASEWSLADKKRSVLIGADHTFAGRRQVMLNASINKFDNNSGDHNEYETGALNLDLPRVLKLLDVSANYRLNRRGNSQTNKTYLKVDDGSGDYILVDSVYVPQSRGDYILVTEQVGNQIQSIETEKHLQFNLDLQKLLPQPIGKNTSIRYEVNSHEIGSENRNFRSAWFMPAESYFSNDAQFKQLNYQYWLKRYYNSIGLRTEVTYSKSRELNLFDVSRPSSRFSETIRLVINKRLGQRDFVEVSPLAENRSESQFNYYSLNLHRRGVDVTGSHFQGAWQYGLKVELSQENADSLSLRAKSYRITPSINYSLSAKGRVELSAFVYGISEENNRSILLQMANGFPTGTNLGGNIKLDFSIADNFSLKILGQTEIRDGEKNRYFLRTELISRFQ